MRRWDRSFHVLPEAAPASPAREGTAGGDATPKRLRVFERPAWGPERNALLGLSAICLIAAAIRFSTIGLQSFDDFEAYTVSLVHMHFGTMLSAIPHYEATPPLYYILAWLWARLGGSGEAWLRSLSAIASVATVPVAYLAARTLASARTALLAAGVLALSPTAVWFAQEARAYALVSLLLAVALLFFLRELSGKGKSVVNVSVWALAAALALVTHYFAALILVPEAVWLALASRLRRPMRLILLIPIVVGVALLPSALSHATGGGAGAGGGEAAQLALAPRVPQTIKQLVVGYNLPAKVPITICGVALCALAALGALRSRSRSERRLAVAGALLTATAVMGLLLLALVGHDYFLSRYLTVVLVPAALLIAVGIASLPRRLTVAATSALALTFCAAIAAVALSPIAQRPDYRDSLAKLPPPPRGGRVVIISSGGTRFEAFLKSAEPMPPGGVAVSQVVVVGLDVVGGRAHHHPKPAVALVPAGFVLRSSHAGRSFVTLTYSASSPVQMSTLPLLGQSRLRLDPTMMIYQPA